MFLPSFILVLLSGLSFADANKLCEIYAQDEKGTTYSFRDVPAATCNLRTKDNPFPSVIINKVEYTITATGDHYSRTPTSKVVEAKLAKGTPNTVISEYEITQPTEVCHAYGKGPLGKILTLRNVPKESCKSRKVFLKGEQIEIIGTNDFHIIQPVRDEQTAETNQSDN